MITDGMKYRAWLRHLKHFNRKIAFKGCKARLVLRDFRNVNIKKSAFIHKKFILNDDLRLKF